FLTPLSVPFKLSNPPPLGTSPTPRMRRADIEVPNRFVDVDSWKREPCYPRSTFYPLSDGNSTLYRRVTKACFRTCSTCQSRSQAPLCLCALRTISNRAEGTFARLRYILGGDRPSQTTHLTLFPPRITAAGSKARTRRAGYQRWLHEDWRPRFKASHLSWTTCTELQRQTVVKVHGVFPSNHGYSASSPKLQFHRIPR